MTTPIFPPLSVVVLRPEGWAAPTAACLGAARRLSRDVQVVGRGGAGVLDAREPALWAEALSRAEHDWVLVAYADEIATRPVAACVTAILAALPDPRDVFAMGCEVPILGGTAPDPGLGPPRQPIRLLNRRFTQVSATRRFPEAMMVAGRQRRVQGCCFLRDGPARVSEYLAMATAPREVAGGRALTGIVAAAAAAFLAYLLRRGGWRAGRRGVVLAFMAANAVFAAEIARWEKLPSPRGSA